jgi:hypothetical protein
LKLVKNTKFATALAAAVCILSMFIGTNKSLAGLAKRVEGQFYSGVVHGTDGYTQPSIDSQLQVSSDAALGLVTVAKNYHGLADRANDVASVRDMLIRSNRIDEKSDLNSALSPDVTLLYDAMADEALSERDRGIADAYYKDFYSAQVFIGQLAEGYNAEVANYNKYANSFPTIVFRLFVNSPDSF